MSSRLKRPKLSKRLQKISLTQYAVIALFLGNITTILFGNLWLAFGLVAFIASLLLPYRKSFGILIRLALTIALMLSATAIIGIIFWAFRINLSPILLVALYFVFVTILCIKRQAAPTLNSQLKAYFPIEDLTALVATILTMLILIIPLTISRDTATLARLIGEGVDNIAHLNYTRLIEANKGYIYSQGQDSPVEAQLGKGATAYPQGYHLNSAIINQALLPTDQPRSVRESLLLFEATAVVSYGLLVYVVAFSATLYIRRFVSDKYKRIIAGTALFTALYLLANILIKLSLDGFQPQIAAMALLFVQIIMLYEYTASSQRKIFHIISILILTSAIGLFYLYLLPVALGLTTFYIGRSIYKKEITLSKVGWGSVGILALASFIQPMLHVLLSHSSISKLNDEGGTLALSISMLIAIVLGALVFVRWQKYFMKFDPMVNLLVLSILFTAAIYVYQLITAGQPSYYFYKSTYVLEIAAAIVLLPAIVIGLTRLKKMKFVLALTVCAIIVGLWSQQSGTLGLYLNGQPYSANYYMARLTVVLAENKDGRDPEAILSVGNNCISADDLRLTRYIMTFSAKANSAQEKIAERSFALSERDEVYERVAQYQKDRNYKKLTIVAGDPQVRKGILNAFKTDTSNIEFIDPYEGLSKESRPYTGCPGIDSRVADL